MMDTPSFLLSSVRGNTQRLDGGAMFGNAPRALWARWCPPDDQNRIALACRALLVEGDGRRLLLETGIGAFFPPELRARYGVDEPDHVLLRSLAALGLSDADISDVILSHLHFDHAGGLLAPHEAGRPPRLLFPNARFFVGEVAFARARHPHLRDRASFIPELPDLLDESGRLHLIREGQTEEPLLPGLRFHRSDGHTPGLLLTEVQGARGAVVFLADLVPGTPWVHLPITMGYDRFPEKLIDEKAALLSDLARRGAYLFYTHDPQVALSRVTRTVDDKMIATDAVPEITRWPL
jgi:glyoxylase-like metal-dependent hydrolase (beta-lactamase superfamily II)